jgi:rhodanese-related sulfurtransferase
MVITVTPHEAADLIAERPVDIIDVRDDSEWSTGHIDGSRLLPLDTLRTDPERLLARGTTILFVCAKGVRSLTAAKLAERLGYENVYSLDGGTKEWARAGFALVVEAASAAA